MKAEIIPVKPAQDNACEGRCSFSELIGLFSILRIFSKNFLMKQILISLSLVITAEFGFTQKISNPSDTALLQPVEINAVRAAKNSPFVNTVLSKKEIEKNNVGFDLPFILNQTPSVQVNSDAGNGIGYTGIRIRGTDATRVNVTLNGIPYNDAESQGTFLVNLPDFAASAGSIQIQRGVGTSSNGTGSFGGSININTNDLQTKKYINFNNNAGSYNSFRNSLTINSGLLKDHFIFTGRLSNIQSDGYIDRSASKLQSFYTSAVYVDDKQSLRINVFSGKEKTHAAWFGIDQATLDSNRRYNPAGTEKPGEPYDNETDNYTQTHYQLFYNKKLNTFWKTNLTLFFTKGKGYFEQYKADQSFYEYGIADYINNGDTIKSTDLTRQLWLDNNFYGTVFSAQYHKNKMDCIIGGTVNNYEGKHFGEITYASVANAIPANYRWYDLSANKKDFSVYVKWNQKISNHWQTFIDLQGRNVLYTINGFKDNPDLLIRNNYFFFNPKAGITYNKGNYHIYFTYGKSEKEPNRDDFEAGANESPKPEKLNDFELGFEQEFKNIKWSTNLYYMGYKDQLVLTGKVNDVYAYTRTNIEKSYRTGIEMEGDIKMNKWMSVNGNLTLSSNKIIDFTEYINEYTEDYDSSIQIVNQYHKTDISFSPSLIGAFTISIIPFKNSEINFQEKFVGRQYLDNTSNNQRMLKAYQTADLRFDYHFLLKKKIKMDVFVQGNNIFSKKYEANGYTYSYIYDGNFTTENYYYPMATFNVMTGLGIRL